MNEVVVRRKEPELPMLPDFREPKTLNEARSNIEDLGSNMAEHAYLVGCNLAWVKQQLEHGEFIPWIENNVWFGQTTAGRFIKYTKHCNLANSLMKYPIEANCAKSTISPELPEGKYSVIYADPPWQYHVGDQHSKEKQETVLGTHYQSMSIGKLCELEIPSADNAVLFMWATSPLVMSQEAFQVVSAWGFEAKACFVWDKVKHNVGHYNSVRHEFLLICIKGTMPHIDKLHDSVVSIERTKHSEKPEYFRELIDKMYPEGKRIELFARKKTKKGWTAWGNECIMKE